MHEFSLHSCGGLRLEPIGSSPCQLRGSTSKQLTALLDAQPKYATYLPHTGGRYQIKRFRKAVVSGHISHDRSNCCLQTRPDAGCGALVADGLPYVFFAQCPIMERVVNSLMYNGRNNGKKLMAVRIMKHCLEIIHLTTDQNPLQVWQRARGTASARHSGAAHGGSRLECAGAEQRGLSTEDLRRAPRSPRSWN